MISSFFKKINNKYLTTAFLVAVFLLVPQYKVEAAVLLPGNISSCGELAVPGTYTLTQNVSNGTDTCFLISSDNVTINGGGFSITSSDAGVTGFAANGQTPAIDARAYTEGVLTEGANGYTNLILNDINIVDFAVGINLSGNDESGNGVNGGYAGDGGDVLVYYSYVAGIKTSGGSSASQNYGGLGGNISLVDTDLDIHDSVFDTGGGEGNNANNTSGGFAITYSGTLNNTNTHFASSLLFFNNNGSIINNYPAGGFPLLPGNISSCGTLYGTGTYTLTANITGIIGTCFYKKPNTDVVLNTNGYSITGVGDNFIDVGNGSNSNGGFTLNYPFTISGFTNLYNGSNNISSPFTITSSGDLDLSNRVIRTEGRILLNYTGNLNTIDTTIPTGFSGLRINGTVYDQSYNGYLGGDGAWPLLPGNISSCGSLYGNIGDTFNLTSDISDIPGTCFYILSPGLRLNGNGHNLSLDINSSAETYAIISQGEYDPIGFTIDSTTVSRYAGLFNGDSKLTIASTGNLDLSNLSIGAASLTLTFGGVLNSVGTIMTTYIQSLVVNGTDYGAQGAGNLFDWVARDLSGTFRSITSSADGTKLAAVVNGGQIYISSDSGVTWTARQLNRQWLSISSDSTGTKLAAVASGGQIYTSTDSGVSWTARESNRNWISITSSADGTKLAAVVQGGRIYTSTDSGVSWTSRESNRNWWSITSSAYGTILAAVVKDGQIYTSTDSGVSWTARESNSSWTSITSSADGTKLAAAGENSEIYTSDDSGVTWTARESSRSWISITSSADGTKLAAVVNGGQIYISSDSGVTWIARGPIKGWWSITSSADGTKLAAVVLGGQIYTHQDTNPDLSVDILNPVSSSVTSWSPIVSWGTATSCYYSYDNFVSTSTANCASLGSDISNPGLGNHTLYVKGIDAGGVVVEKNVVFNFQLPITINSPVSNSTVTSWAPSILWDPNNAGNITNCYYSYDDFVSTSTANCSVSNGGILPPINQGSNTLYLKVVDSNGDVGVNSVEFVYSPDQTWTTRESSRSWRYITSSADGTNLAAVVIGGQIYTSTDSGVTWTARETNRSWRSIASSADGTKLAAVVNGGQIYTSTDSGVTWTARESNRGWNSITSSADGTKLAAVVFGGQIYTSTDSGVTWIARGYSGTWYSIASSADGTKLVAGGHGGLGTGIYTSTDSGVTWTARNSPTGSWWAINTVTSSADGTKLAAVVTNGQIYTSTDSGVTWTARESSRSWISITSSADGTKLAAVVNGGQIYTSTDSGVTWTARESNRGWNSITSSADGTKLAAVVFGGQIYTYKSNPESISILQPTLSQSVMYRAWSALVNWGSSVSCYYSYNNFVSTSTANCSLNGSDIIAPVLQGFATLYIRGVDALSTVANNSVSFLFNTATFLARFETQTWTSIASSVDGVKLVAVASNLSNGLIYTSTDSGITWVSRDSTRNWVSVTSSSNGTNLAAVVNGGQIYTSTNSGVTWTARDSNRNWTSITSSSDGVRLVATVSSGQIYTSTNSGVSWTARDSSRLWTSVASDSTGTNLVATVSNGQIYTSTDSGVTWTARESARAWNSVASDSTGTKLVATVSNGQIYTSTNSGLTWTARESARAWRSVTSSSNGTNLAAVVNSGQIYTSTNSGVTWTARETNRSWRSIASSADGNKLAVVVDNGQIYISAGHFLLSPTSGQSVSTFTSSVDWSNSVSCYYSYDNFLSTSTANCSSAGSDIVAPVTIGNTTLYTKSFDMNSVIATSSVTFDYGPNINSETISSCGTISAAGTYTLTQNITGVTGTCFNVTVPGVTIDGDGYTVTAANGNTSYAVIGEGSILKNINFSGFAGDVNVTGGVNLSYIGDDVDLSNSTTTVGGGSLEILYTNTLSTLNTYFTGVFSLIINHISLGSFDDGYFSWDQQDISTCQTLSAPGTYKLTTDITGVAGTCFNITSDKVIIDGNGHTITSAEGNGVYAIVGTREGGNGHTGIGVSNLTLVGFGGGVDISGGQSVNTDSLTGGNITLYNVVFPTDGTSVNANGSEGPGSLYGGSGGNVTAINSILGDVLVNAAGYSAPAGLFTDINSTFGNVYNNNGSDFITGCMDPAYDNYNPVANYDDGSCTNLIPGIERDIREGEVVNGPIDSNYSGFSNYGIVNGDLMNIWNNYGTTTGSASVYGTNSGYIGGGVMFNTGTNSGYVAGNAGFLSNGINNGTVNGDAYFSGSFYPGIPNQNQGTVNGISTYEFGCTDSQASNYSTGDNIVILNEEGFCQYIGSTIDNNETYTPPIGSINFTNSTSNYGTIVGDAYFDSGSYNYGMVTGDVYFVEYGNGFVEKIVNNNLNVSDDIGADLIWGGTGRYGGNLYGSDSLSGGTDIEIRTITFTNRQMGSYTTQTHDGVYMVDVGLEDEGGTVTGDLYLIGNSTFSGDLTGNLYMWGNGYSSNLAVDGVATLDLYEFSVNMTATSTIFGEDGFPITSMIFNNTTNLVALPSNVNTTFENGGINRGLVRGNANFLDNGNFGFLDYGLYSYTEAEWYGEVLGNITFQDEEVSRHIFDDNSSNYGITNLDSQFGSITYLSNTPINMGTVNATATIVGTSKTISGGNVLNLVKQAITRDTLFIANSVTVRNSATLVGADANNLLTIRSSGLNPVNLNISGPANINFVRLRNINNTGPVIDLSGKTVFDDGGNSGFIFPANTTPSTRLGFTASYTPPALPPSRIPTPPPSNNNNSTPAPRSNNSANPQSGTIDSFFVKKVAPLIFDTTNRFTVFNKPTTNAGNTVIPSPLGGLKNPTVLDLKALPTKFLTNVSNFIFNNTVENNITPALATYLRRQGIDSSKKQDLAKIVARPIRINPGIETDKIADLFTITSGTNPLVTNLSYDNRGKNFIQNIRLSPGQKIQISFRGQGNAGVSGTFEGQAVNFTSTGLSINIPVKPGLYTLKTNTSEVALVIEVVKSIENTSVVEVKAKNVWGVIKSWFR